MSSWGERGGVDIYLTLGLIYDDWKNIAYANSIHTEEG